jgi:hypothetical protein
VGIKDDGARGFCLQLRFRDGGGSPAFDARDGATLGSFGRAVLQGREGAQVAAQLLT